MKNILNLLAVCFLAGGCATTPTSPVTTYIDPVSGQRTDLLADNLLETAGQPRELVWLNASRVFTSRGSGDYYLEVSYMARAEVGHLEIPPGETLTLALDGVELKFNGTGSANQRKAVNKELVKENALYPTSRLQLQKIATARQVKVTIKGNRGLIEREFAPVNFENFRRFVTRYAP